MKTKRNNLDNALAERTHKEMLEVLMDPKSAGPDTHYFMIRGGSEKKNITIWQSGLAGNEYIKTYGHYHINDFLETYKILFGEGIVLLQVRKTDEKGLPLDDEIDYIKAIFVKAGNEIQIPKNAGHLMVNIGKSWLITADNSPVNFGKSEEASWPAHADYKPVKKMRGFAYYVVKKDNHPVFIKNPNYKNTPEIIIEK